MNDIKTILKMLDWNNDKSVQKKGIEMATKTKEIEPFLQPLTDEFNKNVWDNCAKIISMKTDRELKEYTKALLEWIEDLNWPGAIIILRRLKDFEGGLLIDEYVKAVRKASDTIHGDENWLANLYLLFENKKLKKLIPPDIVEMFEEQFGNSSISISDFKIYDDFID